MLAPILLNSATCINLFSNTVSITTPVPLDTVSIAINWAWTSVGNPGCGKVFISTAFNFSGPITLIDLSISITSQPASLNLAVTGFKCSNITFSTVISPFVIAAATMKVAASILSGITSCSVAVNSLTPFILIVLVPAPLTSAPISFKKFAKSFS